MPKLRSLRAKMLALILLPVIVALAAVTLLAISRASSAQEKSAYAELNQRTAVESAKVDAAVAGVPNIANSAALILSTSNSRADAIAGMAALQTAAKGSVVAVFGGLLPNTFGSDAAPPASLARSRTARSSRASRSTRRARSPSPPARTASRAPRTSSSTRSPGVQEPAAYEGTMYVTYQAPVQRGGKVVGFAGTASTLALIDARIGKMQVLRVGVRVRDLGQGHADRQPGQGADRQGQPRRARRRRPATLSSSRSRTRSRPARAARSRPRTRSRARTSSSRGRRSTPRAGASSRPSRSPRCSPRPRA